MNPNEKTKITVSLMDDGSIRMNGPLEDKILCYGMLEVARQIVANHQPPKKIVVPELVPPKLN